MKFTVNLFIFKIVIFEVNNLNVSGDSLRQGAYESTVELTINDTTRTLLTDPNRMPLRQNGTRTKQHQRKWSQDKMALNLGQNPPPC